MKRPIVIIGIGEVAGVLARAFLRDGLPVVPVTRHMDIIAEAKEISDPLMVVLGVGEKDFSSVLKTIPDGWRDSLVFIQNELLPQDWEVHGIENPTVLSVWFEKKKSMDYKPLLPTPILGIHADLIAESLDGIDIPCTILESREEMLVNLVQKNVFILTTNIAGLALDEGATTATLWAESRQLALDVANDAIDLQEALTGQSLPRELLIEGLVQGLGADPHHKCKGRSAPARLARAIAIADKEGVKIKSIRDLAKRLN